MHELHFSRRKLLQMMGISALSLFKARNALGANTLPRIILLKLDDVVEQKDRGLSDAWKRVRDFLIQEHIPASFGIIGESLERPSNIYIEELKAIARSSQFEIWNHGYTNHFVPNLTLGVSAANVGPSADLQYDAINTTQNLIFSRLGVTSRIFGPHNSATDDNTYAAIARIPDIQAIWFYGPRQSNLSRTYIFKREANLEQPIFVPNLSGLQRDLTAQTISQPYIALQGHPDMWSMDRFQAFTEVVSWLSAQGCKFMCASEYLRSPRF